MLLTRLFKQVTLDYLGHAVELLSNQLVVRNTLDELAEEDTGVQSTREADGQHFHPELFHPTLSCTRASQAVLSLCGHVTYKWSPGKLLWNPNLFSRDLTQGF